MRKETQEAGRSTVWARSFGPWAGHGTGRPCPPGHWPSRWRSCPCARENSTSPGGWGHGSRTPGHSAALRPETGGGEGDGGLLASVPPRPLPRRAPQPLPEMENFPLPPPPSSHLLSKLSPGSPALTPALLLLRTPGSTEGGVIVGKAAGLI